MFEWPSGAFLFPSMITSWWKRLPRYWRSKLLYRSSYRWESSPFACGPLLFRNISNQKIQIQENRFMGLLHWDCSGLFGLIRLLLYVTQKAHKSTKGFDSVSQKSALCVSYLQREGDCEVVLPATWHTTALNKTIVAPQYPWGNDSRTPCGYILKSLWGQFTNC